MTGQAPGTVVMVRPTGFTPNSETAADNFFQTHPAATSARALAAAAFVEVTQMTEQLETAGVDVLLFDDPDPLRPDSVFPNNWLSTHPDGRVALYPMYAQSRRRERRHDIVQALRRDHRITSIHDYSVLEDDDLFLEGTGAMVLDHVHRVAYVCRSRRADERAVSMVCGDLGYRPLTFSAHDGPGRPIYHTNVMMAVGSALALVCLKAINDDTERRLLVQSLRETGHEVLDLTTTQMAHFAGNALEVAGADSPLLLMSSRGWASLDATQRRTVEEHLRVLTVDVPSIELAGGSVRCMVAGVHLPARAGARRVTA